jgi:ornithine cyclodeaminase/alanine dehydrogenase
MPPVEDRLRLAERTMTALASAGASELPSKIGIHPRPSGSFAHAMPAHLRAGEIAEDLVGMKWVAGFSTNNAVGLPSISAVVVLNDPETGLPTAIVDAGPITAERTAAVSGVGDPALRAGRRGRGWRGVDVALVGAGVQGHVAPARVGAVLPGCTLHSSTASPSARRARREARAHAGIADAVVHDTARAPSRPPTWCHRGVLRAASERQSMTNAWLRPTRPWSPSTTPRMCAAEVARDAALFLVDHASSSWPTARPATSTATRSGRHPRPRRSLAARHARVRVASWSAPGVGLARPRVSLRHREGPAIAAVAGLRLPR